MQYKFFKRFFDIILSLVLIIGIFPLLLFTFIVIKIESKGPAIFRQKRLGLNTKVFTIFKFRSMYMNAEKGGVYETKNDPRVTRVGKFIRKTSIDELPQLFNILRGDMSVIGPRPTLTYHPWPVEQYTSFQRKRFTVRPGVTGWAQINGRKDVIWDERIKMDVFYVENMSLTFDLKIFFKTIRNVLLMKDNLNKKETVIKNI